MTSARLFLIQALQRVIDGGDIEREELDTAIPNPLGLARDEKHAWERLSHWADDADVREVEERYARFKRMGCGFA